MTPSQASVSLAGTRSKELQDLVESFLARIEAGEKIDLEEFLREHPDQAEELRPLLVPIELLGQLGPAAPPERQEAALGVLGDYRIVREIGRGGMGIVLEAEQLSLQRRVALKMLPFAATLTHQLKRFENEVRAAASLEHPHIVPVYGVGCERGIHFYAMRFIDGFTLADLIDRQNASSSSNPTATYTPERGGRATEPNAHATTDGGPHAPAGPLPRDLSYFRRVSRWIAQAADALEYAHSLGIVHRDVKPGNLMIDREDKLWVTDFGLALFGQDTGITMSGDLVGTLRYMSPEQARAEHGTVDHRTDVYSLGATLYELLTLRSAIEGRDRTEILLKIAVEEPQRVRKINPAVPQDLETIAHKAIEKNAGDRYATARQLAEDLRRWETDLPIKAKRPTLWNRTRKFLRRHQAVATTVALATFVGLLGSIGILWASNVRIREEEKAKGEALEAKTEALGKSEQARKELAASLRESAKLALGQGISLFEQGEAGRGLLWQARALKMLPEDSEELGDSIRSNLGTLSRVLHPLKAVVDYADTSERPTWSFGPDGKTVAIRENRSTVRLLEVRTGRLLGNGLKLPHVFQAQAYAPDGKTLVTLSHKGFRDKVPEARLHRWETTTGQALGDPLAVPGAPKLLVLHPAGEIAATAADGVVHFWNLRQGVATGVQIAWAPAVEWMGYSPDGKIFATIGRDPKNRNGFEVQVWDPATGKAMGPALSSLRSNRFEDIPELLDLERRRVLLLGKEGVRLHDLLTGMAVGDALSAFETTRNMFGPDGSVLGLDADQKTLRFWEAGAAKPKATLMHTAPVGRVQFRADGKMLLVTGKDDTVRIWDVATGKQQKEILPHPAVVLSAAFSPDGAFVITGARDNLVRIWRADNGKLLDPPLRHEGSVSAEFGPDSGSILTYSSQGYGDGGHTRLWSLGGVRADKVLEVDREVLAFGMDGKTILVGRERKKLPVGGKGAARLQDLETGKALGPDLLQPHLVEIGAIAPDGTTAATGYYAFEKVGKRSRQRGYVQLWNGRTGKVLSPALFHEQSLGEQGVVFSRDGKLLLTCDYSGHGHVWDAADGRRLGDKFKHHLKEEEGTEPIVDALALGPDGKMLATAAWDRRVCLWDRGTGKLLHALDHPNYVFSVAFSPDGRRLATGCGDNRARLFDTATGKQVGPTLVHHGRGAVGALVFSPNGRYLVTSSQDDTVRVWNAASGRPVGPYLPQAPVEANVLGITRDGKTLLTASQFTVHSWPMPQPLPGSPERIELWAQVHTGMELDEYGVVRWLDTPTWRERREQLEKVEQVSR